MDSCLTRLRFCFIAHKITGGIRFHSVILCRIIDTVQTPTRDEKTDLPNVKGEVKRAIKATFAHLCITLTRDKCLPLLAVKGESSGDKGRFCPPLTPTFDARQRYISLAFVPVSKASSNMSEIQAKGVTKAR